MSEPLPSLDCPKRSDESLDLARSEVPLVWPSQFGKFELAARASRDEVLVYVREVGKRVKKWAGYYHIYVIAEDGKERRRKKFILLAPKSQMKKWEAETKLRGIIEQETGGNQAAKPDPELTFDWFWKKRFLPLKEGKWARSQRDIVTLVMDKHVLPRFGV